MLDTPSSAPSSPDKPREARLSTDELNNLVRSANRRHAFGGDASQNAYERTVTLPKGGTARCEWRLGMNSVGEVETFLLRLRSNDEPTELATFLFDKRWDESSNALSPFWELRHREVQSTERRGGVGTFMLQAGEDMVRQLHARFPNSPTEIRFSAVGQPQVVDFAERNGYVRMDTPDGRLYETFLAESKSPEQSSSSFILARLFREEHDLGMALFSKDKLRKAYSGLASEPEDRFHEHDAEGTPIVRLGKDEELIYERGVVLVSLRKDVGPIAESAAQA